MGLLNNFFGNADQTQALGLLGVGMMNGGFQQGAGMAMQHLAGAGDRNMQRELGLLRMEEARMNMEQARQAQAARQQMQEAARASFVSPERATAMSMGPMPDGSNVPQVQSGFNPQQFLNKMYSIDPLKAMELQKQLAPAEKINKLDAKDFTPESVQRFQQSGNYADLVRMDKLHFADTGGRVAGLNPFTGQQVGGVDKTGNPFNDLILADGSGALRPNMPLIGAKSQVARAGASNNNISINTEKSLLNEVAGGLGKGITDAKGGAQAALGTISTVGRLMDALDSGQVIAGPGTTFRQYGLQVGNMLGVAGQSAQEKLLNTRQAIQSLAQLELDAAQQMKGQGQITEAERSIIRRAASGDIDGMTAPELRLLGGVLDRTARTKIRSFNDQVKPLMSNPNAAPIAPFLNVEEPPARAASAPAVRRYNPATGRIE